MNMATDILSILNLRRIIVRQEFAVRGSSVGTTLFVA